MQALLHLAERHLATSVRPVRWFVHMDELQERLNPDFPQHLPKCHHKIHHGIGLRRVTVTCHSTHRGMTHSGGRKTYLTCPHRQTAVFQKCIGLSSISYPRQHWLRHNQRGPCTSAYLGFGLDTDDLYLHQASNEILLLTIFFGRYPLSLRGRGPCSATRDSADFLESRVCMVTRSCAYDSNVQNCLGILSRSGGVAHVLCLVLLFGSGTCKYREKKFRPSRPTENLGWPTHKKNVQLRGKMCPDTPLCCHRTI